MSSGGGGRPRRQVLKVILLGDSGVGKTSLMRQYVTKKFDNRFKATIGADFFSKELEIEGNPVSLHIWDTAGQERFQSLGTAFYRGADVCLLVFDITNAASFTSLNTWMQEFNFQSGNQDGTKKHLMLVANKADLKEGGGQAVYGNTIKEFCASVPQPDGSSMRYFETSAKQNTSVEELFLAAAQTAFHQKLKELKSADADVVAGSVSIGKKRNTSGMTTGRSGGQTSGNEKPKKSCNC